MQNKVKQKTTRRKGGKMFCGKDLTVDEEIGYVWDKIRYLDVRDKENTFIFILKKNRHENTS